MIDRLLSIVHEFDPALELKYNKFYIGLAKDGRPRQNFVVFRPRKNTLVVDIRLKPSTELESKLEASGLEAPEYGKRQKGVGQPDSRTLLLRLQSQRNRL
jgi:hypothetical protein